jgi:hypothetical protein
MLDTDEFLFPRALQLTDTPISKCLIVGSCVAEVYVPHFRGIRPDAVCDFILFNNVADLPQLASSQAREYDFQFIQLPLRHIVSDIVIRFHHFSDDVRNAEISDNAHQLLRLMLDSALAYHTTHGLTTFVSNFVVPQIMTFSGLTNMNSEMDLRSLVRSLNQRLYEYVGKLDNVYIIDIENIAASMGKRDFLDDTLVFSTHGAFWYPDWVNLERGRIEPRRQWRPFRSGTCISF